MFQKYLRFIIFNDDIFLHTYYFYKVFSLLSSVAFRVVYGLRIRNKCANINIYMKTGNLVLLCPKTSYLFRFLYTQHPYDISIKIEVHWVFNNKSGI